MWVYLRAVVRRWPGPGVLLVLYIPGVTWKFGTSKSSNTLSTPGTL